VILLDSDVIIAHLRGHPAARGWLEGVRVAGEVLALSAVSGTEILGGMHSDERHQVRRLLDSFRCLPVSREVGWRAGALRRRYRRSHSEIGTVYYLIAATAELDDCELATLNVKHYPMFSHLRAPFDLTEGL